MNCHYPNLFNIGLVLLTGIALVKYIYLWNQYKIQNEVYQDYYKNTLEVKEKLSKMESENSNLKKQLIEITRKTMKINVDLNNMKGEKRTADNSLDQSKIDLGSANKKVQELTKAVEVEQAKSATLESDNKIINDALQPVKTELQKVQAELDELKKTKAKIQ